MAMPPLVRGLVPSSWITCAVTEGSKDLLTVPTMELASTTVYTLTMLVSDVKVSSYIKDHNRCIYAYESVCVHTHTHTHTHRRCYQQWSKGRERRARNTRREGTHWSTGTTWSTRYALEEVVEERVSAGEERIFFDSYA